MGTSGLELRKVLSPMPCNSTIQRILISASVSLRDALVKLNETGLQILLIVDEGGRLIGVLTDGDVRRSLLRDISLDTPVAEVMNRNFKTLPEADAEKAHELLRRSKFNHLPIIDHEGKLVELVSGSNTFLKNPNYQNVKVVIMAGGKGSRLSPLTHIVPKPLMPVGEQTMLEKIMDNFAQQGFQEFKVIVNYKKELIKSYFAEVGSPYSIEFIDEESYLGTAGGLAALDGGLASTFILTNCDILAELSYSNLLDWHHEHEADLTILGVHRRLEIPYGVIKADSGSYVTGIEEKPSYHHVIVSGIYVVEPTVIAGLPRNTALGMDKLILELIKQGRSITCYPIDKGWFDMGQFEEYRSLLKHFGVLDV